MASRKRRKNRNRLPRTMLSLVSLVVALAAGYVAGKEVSGTTTHNRERLFADFAGLDLTLEELTRLPDSLPQPAAKPSREPWLTIRVVSDGDTVKLADGRIIRLIGIDAPESGDNRKLHNDIQKMGGNVDPSQLIALGNAAAAHAKRLAEGKRCWLEYDRERLDLYGRTLAYVHLEDGKVLNEAMLADGYAKAYLNNRFKYMRRYVALQGGAKLDRRGLWGER